MSWPWSYVGDTGRHSSFLRVLSRMRESRILAISLLLLQFYVHLSLKVSATTIVLP